MENQRTLSARHVPLIGREEELAAGVEALSTGGFVIAGAAGVGKSRLAADLAARAGGPAEHVLATASARAMPFGAFAHLLIGRFADLGLDLFAAEAAVFASETFARSGKRDSARRTAALSSLHAVRCQGARTPALALRPQVAPLTAREREVAMLTARGHSNAEIAEMLVLSIRTVESHVLRACRKLGVRDRQQLAALIDAF